MYPWCNVSDLGLAAELVKWAKIEPFTVITQSSSGRLSVKSLRDTFAGLSTPCFDDVNE